MQISMMQHVTDMRPLAETVRSNARIHACRPAEPGPSNWLAELELSFEFRDGKTRLARRRHLGPLLVQSPFYPEADGTCHVYLLHPPGGIAGGDKLDMRFHLAPGTRTVMTTPGATKFYRSMPHGGELHTSIDVGAAAVCEYLPQETILFDGTDAVIDTRVSLEAGATFVGWDFLSLGRPAADEQFTTGRVRQRTEIICEGKPVWVERLHIRGGSPLLMAPYGLAGHPILGTMVYVGPAAADAGKRVRDALDGDDDAEGVFSVSQLEKAIVCRYLGRRSSQAKKIFARAWGVLRTTCQDKPASAPRIWAT
jgi:urease accessory protein